MTRYRPLRLLAPALCLALLLSSGQAAATAPSGHGDFESTRSVLLSYMLRNLLTQNHFSHKTVNDELSVAAFDVYLKQLDYQKRFLLQGEVDQLRGRADQIDDELRSGRIELPELAADLLQKGIERARKAVHEILEKDSFDFNREEYLQTDPEKLAFCVTEAELKERWRQILKYQVMNRYLNLLEDTEAPETATKEEREAELRQKALEKVRENHEEYFTRLLKDTGQDHIDRYFNAVAQAYDPHTGYLPPDKKEDFDIGMRGSLEGIGATLREEGGYIKVVAIIPGSASWRQGQLQAEDIILSVAAGTGEAVDITDMRLRDAVSLIRGPKGTEVRLTVKKPDGTRQLIAIVRDVVEIEETFAKGVIHTDEKSGKTFGYLKIPSFYRDFAHQGRGEGRNVTDDVRTELQKFTAAKVSGVVLDLRNNGGGALTDAVRIAGLFISKGPVVQVRDSAGKIDVLKDENREIAFDGPLVVLVNQFSASASEILAGALQDYGRAVVIGGEHTYGKGTVQSIVDLDRAIPFRNMEKYKPLGALKVTIQKFYRISGESTQYRGVIPDIILPDRLQHLEAGERYLDFSLPWDTVEQTSFERWPDARKNLALIRYDSKRRVEADPDFSEIVEEAALAEKRKALSQQSLRLEDLRREREQTRQPKEMAGPNPHAGGEMPDVERKSDADGEKDLIEAITQDPYAREAMAVLTDLSAAVDDPARTAAAAEAAPSK